MPTKKKEINPSLARVVMELPTKGWFGVVDNVVGSDKSIPTVEINADRIDSIARAESMGSVLVVISQGGVKTTLFCTSGKEASLVIEFIHSCRSKG